MDVFADGSLSTWQIAALVVSLLLAIVFEAVNGFHDTANAVATVIYTKTLPPFVAVILSGVCNFLGVFLGGIGVAIAVTRLLPVELLVEGGTGRGLAMVGALLVTAIAWNLGTWWRGLPASSSHTLIGSILGVGIASSALEGRFGHGVNWTKAREVFTALLVSPVCGFVLAAIVLLAMRAALPRASVALRAPEKDVRAPIWVRAILVATCSGVSFAHGSNDGQKGVGLVMLILVGIVPAGFALDASAPATQLARAHDDAVAIARIAGEAAGECADAEAPLCVVAAEARVIEAAIGERTSVSAIAPDDRWAARVATIRIDGALRELAGGPLSDGVLFDLGARRARIATLTDYAPPWVLIAVALALGIGTTVGWKRIVVTVGEKIGRTHLTYAQGASAELVAMCMIGASAWIGLPVSTTHVLSSGIAGTMVAEKAGVQVKTVRDIALAWLLTLPVTMALSGLLFFLFSSLAGE